MKASAPRNAGSACTQTVRTFDLPDSDTHEMQWVRIVPRSVYGREYPLLPAYLDGTQPDSDTLTR